MLRALPVAFFCNCLVPHNYKKMPRVALYGGAVNAGAPMLDGRGDVRSWTTAPGN